MMVCKCFSIIIISSRYQLVFEKLYIISEYIVCCCFRASLKAGIVYINSTSGWKKVPFSADKG